MDWVFLRLTLTLVGVGGILGMVWGLLTYKEPECQPQTKSFSPKT
jgi:hypothetical protein